MVNGKDFTVETTISGLIGYIGTADRVIRYLIWASRSESHINHSYEKITVHLYVCMYVCMYVCEVYVAIRRPRGHSACAQSMR